MQYFTIAGKVFYMIIFYSVCTDCNSYILDKLKPLKISVLKSTPKTAKRKWNECDTTAISKGLTLTQKLEVFC